MSTKQKKTINEVKVYQSDFEQDAIGLLGEIVEQLKVLAYHTTPGEGAEAASDVATGASYFRESIERAVRKALKESKKNDK